MDAILCPQCNYENPVEARVCEQCNADLSPVKSIVDTANSHYNQALSMAHEGKLDEALGHLDAAIALSSHNPAFYNLLGTINAQKGLFSEAIRAWEKCLALNPEIEKAFNNIEKARRMEEVRAEEHELQPLWMKTTISYAVAGIFILITIILAINSYSKSSRINTLSDDLVSRSAEASSWKSQFESLTAQFPAEGINGVLKKLTQAETLVADRDKRIEDLEEKAARNSDNFRERVNDYRENIKKVQEEKADLLKQLKTIDNLKTVIVQNETQIETLQETVTNLRAALTTANERAETHKGNLLLAQNNIRDLKASRDSLLENAQKNSEKEIQEIRNQLLELRDEIAIWERKDTERKYAEQLTVEAIQHLEQNDFALAGQNLNTALERNPDSPAALYYREKLDRILDDPLEQEIRLLEKSERETRRAELKTKLIAKNRDEAQQAYNTGNYDKAIDIAQRTLRLQPESKKDIESLNSVIAQSEERNKEIVFLLLEARKQIEAKNYKEADSKLKQVFKRSPSHEEASSLMEQINR